MKKYLLIAAFVLLGVGSVAAQQNDVQAKAPTSSTIDASAERTAASSATSPSEGLPVSEVANAGAVGVAAQAVTSGVAAAAVGATKKPGRVKIDRGVEQKTFVAKGTWFGGGRISYTDIGAGNYKFLLFDNLSAKSFLFGAKIFAGYTFANNVAAGVSFDYSRTLIKIDNVDMNLGSGLNFQIKDFYSIQQIYTATAFLRTYINIGNSKRFGMFNDIRAYFGGGQGKVTNGSGAELTGTYEKILKMGVVLAPGISVFATDFMTVEATIGIFGIEYSRTEQISNQVYQGSFETFNASFQLNLLSIGLGIALYF